MSSAQLMLECPVCGRTWAPDARIWQCPCGGLLELRDRPPFSQPAIQVPTSIWRYRAMLPIREDQHIVSLGEGMTPLIPVDVGGQTLDCKLEFLSPTGSYKDRGAAVMISMLREIGVTAISEDSSGNAAASVAAYAARAGIHTRIFVPADTSPAKLTQISSYGAELVRVSGGRQNAALAAQEDMDTSRSSSYYASHNYNPFFLEGLRTLAYEIWEQTRPNVPDWVVAPVGNGGLLVGVYRGFRDLRLAGLIPRVPHMLAVQARACAPIYNAYSHNAEQVEPIEGGVTLAEGIRISHPVRGVQVLEAIRASSGLIVTVDDDQIIEAQALLAHQGLFVEPTSATVVAALLRLPAGMLEGARVVAILTGSGLKAIH